MASPPIRCFIGIFFDEICLHQIQAYRKPLEKLFLPNTIKWSNSKQIHLTLRFLGTTSPNLLPTLQGSLNQVAKESSAFQLALSQINYFPTVAHPKVLIFSLDHSEALLTLVKKIETCVQIAGFPKEEKEFLSHITLGRFKSYPLADLPKRESLNYKFHVSQFSLMQSQTLPSGAKYTQLASFSLKEGQYD